MNEYAIRDYKLIKKIGMGGQGEIWFGQNIYTKMDVAVKFSRSSLESEMQILSCLHCKGIPCLIHYQKEERYEYIVEQYHGWRLVWEGLTMGLMQGSSMVRPACLSAAQLRPKA